MTEEKTLKDIRRDVKSAAKASIKILEDKEASPGDRSISLNILMIGLSRTRAEIELKRAEAITLERKAFSRVLDSSGGKSREERLAAAKGSAEVSGAGDHAAQVEAVFVEVKMLIAGLKHAIMTMRGLMGMKE